MDTKTDDPDVILGQDRAIEAMSFAVGMGALGYNLFVLGPAGTGKHTVVRQFLEKRAADEPTPDDWCYVHGFRDPRRPRALRLPSGRGTELRDDLGRLVEDLKEAIPAALQGEDYRNRRRAIEQHTADQQLRLFEVLAQTAKKRGIGLERGPKGFSFAPLGDGKPLDEDEFKALPEPEQKRLKRELEGAQEQLRSLLWETLQREQQAREAVRQLEREVTNVAVGHLIDKLRAKYESVDAVLAWLDDLQTDVVAHTQEFAGSSDADGAEPLLRSALGPSADVSRRYGVNVLVGRDENGGAPIVYEDHPVIDNLVGRVERIAELGTLTTDLTHIRAGALHRANGGYLILDADKTLRQPLAWDALKRALRSREVRIQSLGDALGLTSTIGLDPEPIPIDVKVVLVGDRALYYLLAKLDPEVSQLFKVAADFEEDLQRTDTTARHYARFLSAMASRESLRPLERGAIARVLEHASRIAGDSNKLSLHVQQICDLLREADYWAGSAERTEVEVADVERALEAQIRRADRMRLRSRESIREGALLIDTSGEAVGRINGLSVLELGGFRFGHPMRITARARLGKGQVVDIEREVELGGPIHSKGVLILSGFLGARYAGDRPLSVAATLVFEQSYGGVEGDSASLAELCALLSALAGIAVRQGLAVTGSINQYGEAQVIGAVNEKIEGFFDVCEDAGLDGSQGVIIPASNVRHLMLRRDVVEAVEAGTFSVYAVRTIDEVLELLTGMEAGEPDAAGRFPSGTFNRAVEDGLARLTSSALAFAQLQDADITGPRPRPDGAHEAPSGSGRAPRSDPS